MARISNQATSAAESSRKPKSKRSSLPRLSSLLGNLVAAVSVAMVGVPQSLAYAELAGMPPVAGLYAGAVPPLLAAMFASSPYLQTGPVAITALLTYGALSTEATPGSSKYVTLGLGLAFVVGVVRMLLGLLRAGWIAYLMSQPMLLGFVPASAILIASSQAPKALGADPPEFSNTIVKAAWALGHPGSWNPAAIGMTMMALAVILGGCRVHKLFPGILLAAVIGIIVSMLGVYQGDIVNEVPAGFPPLTVDDLPWDKLPSLLLPGVLIALIGFTEAASISRRFASESREHWSANRELVSQGVANVAAACTGGFPCGGSFSRSSLNRMSGAQTRLSGGITGLAVLAFLPFTAALEPLPLAVLGAIVIAAVVNLLRFRPLIQLWRISVPQALIAWSTFLTTVLLAPRLDWAVLIGIGLSVSVFLWRSLQMEIDVKLEETALRLTPRGVLWFGTAQHLDTALLQALASHPDVQGLQVDLSRLGRIDTTGALMLRSTLEQARVAGLETEAVGVPPQSKRLVERVLAPSAAPIE